MSIYLNDLTLYQLPRYIKENWISASYIILTAALFIAGFVTLYHQRSINKGYKVIVVSDCILFVAMIYFFLNFFKDNNFFFLLILYGTLSLSAMLFYYRLSENQFEFVRYELVWPAIYTIALSAYMGYVLVLYSSGNEGGVSLIVPILVLLLYEYVLFLSDIPKAEVHEGNVIVQNNKIGFVHIIFLLFFWFLAVSFDSCKIAVYFLLFCSASIILESLDVIMRKESDSVKEKYDSAMCFAISILSLGGSVTVTLMERIPIIHAVFLIIIIEIYGIVFYNIRKMKNCTGARIDVVKLVSFITSVIVIFSLFILEKNGFDLIKVLEELIDLSKLTTWIMAGVSAGIIALLSGWPKEITDLISKIKKSDISLRGAWQKCRLSRLYLYLGVADAIAQIALQLGAQRKFTRVKTGTLFLFIIFFLNLVLYGMENFNKDSDHEKKAA